MKVNSFSFMDYSSLRELSKKKNSPLLKVVIAYKNPITSRSILSLEKLSSENNKYAQIAKEYLFFRLLKAKKIKEAISLGSTFQSELISFVLEFLSFFENVSTTEEIYSKNAYLYFLLYYFPFLEEDIDLAYSFPEGKYGEGLYMYSLLRTAYGLKKTKKRIRSLFKNAKGIRAFLSLSLRDSLDLFFKNNEIMLEDFLKCENIHFKHQNLKKLSAEERQKIIDALLEFEAIEIRKNRIIIREGGIFLLGCFNLDKAH